MCVREGECVCEGIGQVTVKHLHQRKAKMKMKGRCLHIGTFNIVTRDYLLFSLTEVFNCHISAPYFPEITEQTRPGLFCLLSSSSCG